MRSNVCSTSKSNCKRYVDVFGVRVKALAAIREGATDYYCDLIKKILNENRRQIALTKISTTLNFQMTWFFRLLKLSLRHVMAFEWIFTTCIFIQLLSPQVIIICILYEYSYFWNQSMNKKSTDMEFTHSLSANLVIHKKLLAMLVGD